MVGDNKITLDQQKEIQLSILKELRKICDSNNITYFLGGGTLLGAIRHKGYIPWDDDIDIMLPRKDYEKLLSIFNEQCKNNQYKLITFKNTKGYYYPFAKIIDLRTKLLEYYYEEIEEMGVYIDIFPIDFLPENEEKIKKLYKKYKIQDRILAICRISKNDKLTKNKVKLFIKKPIKWFLEKFRIYKIILSSMDKLGEKKSQTNIVACISGRYFEKEIMPSDYMSDYILVDFEKEKFKVPIGYDDYLKKHYGDYMKLPPKDKQKPDHVNIAYWR